jgi:hypothetical protein
MSTAERIVLGLLSFIALIAWCRWRGVPQDQKTDEPPVAPELASQRIAGQAKQ